MIRNAVNRLAERVEAAEVALVPGGHEGADDVLVGVEMGGHGSSGKG